MVRYNLYTIITHLHELLSRQKIRSIIHVIPTRWQPVLAGRPHVPDLHLLGAGILQPFRPTSFAAAPYDHLTWLRWCVQLQIEILRSAGSESSFLVWYGNASSPHYKQFSTKTLEVLPSGQHHQKFGSYWLFITRKLASQKRSRTSHWNM